MTLQMKKPNHCFKYARMRTRLLRSYAPSQRLKHRVSELMNMRLLIVILSIAAGAQVTNAASINCSHGLSAVESTVCSSKLLTRRDFDLAAAYRSAIDISTETERQALKLEQKEWLTKIRDKCESSDCVSDAYARRTTYLQDVYQHRLAVNLPDSVFEEMYRRSNITPGEMRAFLKDCIASQSSMNACMFVQYVLEDLKLEAQVKDKKDLLKACNTELDNWVRSWRESRDARCTKSSARVEGGTMHSGLFIGCQTASTQKYISQVKAISKCASIPQTKQ
jgi:uncharacterized protein